MKRLFVLFLLAGALASGSQSIKIASAAGYKKPLQKIIKTYREQGGAGIDAIFGNMKQVCVQAQHTDIALLIGDRDYLADKSALPFAGFETLGSGRLVLAYPKGSTIATLDALSSEAVKTVAMPQPSKAIYGIAAEVFLRRSGLYEVIKDKLRIVATVPQVATYLAANEVDAGLMNLTAALANETRIGGYLLVPQEHYDKIDIVAGRLPSCSQNPECRKFIDFLHTEAAQRILKRYGL